jgi:antitoxin HigA-1
VSASTSSGGFVLGFVTVTHSMSKSLTTIKEVTVKKRPPIHPGRHLAEFLEDYNLTQYALAKALGVPQLRISQIVRGQRGITADTALRLSRYFGNSAQFWLNLQTHYDLETAKDALGKRLEQEVLVRA